MPDTTYISRRAAADRKARLRAGKELRRSVPRELHAELLGSRRRSALAILARDDLHRVKFLVPLRYKLMGEDAFSFLRGAAAVMAMDLADQPQTGLSVQACGDAHLMNFGAFVTPEGNIAFDVNDFDQTLAGIDFTVDLKRLAASTAVAALAAQRPRKDAREVSALAVRAYRLKMHELSTLSPAEIWQSRIDLEDEVAKFKDSTARQKIEKVIDRARGKGGSKDGNFPRRVKNGHRIANKKPKIFHLDGKRGRGLELNPNRLFAIYGKGLTPDRWSLLARYRMQDIVFKAVGVGSVGTFCCVALFESADNEPLFLQVKEARRSVLERVNGKASYPGNQGRRVVEGQRLMQAASDIFLGYSRDKSGRDFYVRALKNRRLDDIGDVGKSHALAEYSALCGRTLAHAHARSGEPASIAGYMGQSDAMDEALASFAIAYADQTATDHAELVKAHGK